MNPVPLRRAPAEVHYLSAESLFIKTVIMRTSAFVFKGVVFCFFFCNLQAF